MSHIGRQVEFIRKEPLSANRCTSSGERVSSGECVSVPQGTRGVVIRDNNGLGPYTVAYHVGNGIYARFNHSPSYEGRNYRFIGSSTSATLTIEQQGVMELFLASSTETIDGVVPQVKYGKVIVWQGEPVDATDKTEDEVSTEACQVAQDKINEVVKKQFS